MITGVYFAIYAYCFAKVKYIFSLCVLSINARLPCVNIYVLDYNLTVKFLMCGSRKFNDAEVIVRFFNAFVYQNDTVIVGDAKGADTIVKVCAEELGCCFKVYKAQWLVYKNGAGVVRNQQMLDCEHVNCETKIDCCVAFYNTLTNGTKDMIDRCKSQNISTLSVKYYE